MRVEDDLAAEFAQAYPQAKRVADKRAILEDASHRAGRLGGDLPRARAARGRGDAARQGRDERQAGHDHARPARRGPPRAGRDRADLFDLYSEHFEVPATVRAGELVAAGAIGKVVHTVGLGPHRLRNNQPAGLVLRPRALRRHPDRHRLAPVSSSSCSSPAPTTPRCCRRASPTARNPDTPGLQDVGDMHLATPTATGYDPRRLVHPGRPADLGRRAADHHRHRGLRSSCASTSTSPGGRAATTCSSSTRTGVRHIDCSATRAALRAGSSSPTSATAPRRRCRRRAASRRWRLALTAQALAERERLVEAMRKIWNVAVVGCGIGRSHIVEGYVPNPDRSGCAALCDLDEARLATRRRRVRHRAAARRRSTTCSPMPTIDIIDICTPPVLHRPHGRGGARRRQARRSARSRWSARSPRSTRSSPPRRARSGMLMPIFQYRYGDGIEKAKRIIDAGHRRQALRRHASRRCGGATPDYYAVPWRGKWATELGGVLVTHAIHPHDMCAADGRPGGAGVRPGGDAGQRHRGRGLRHREPR